MTSAESARLAYQGRMAALKAAFADRAESGVALIRDRAFAADELVRNLWHQHAKELNTGIAALAVGGYGRQELFPASDLDLLFVVADADKEKSAKPVIRQIKRVSRPGRRVYTQIKDLQRVLNGLGISILSTPRGVLSDKEAREQNVGGEILCQVF